MTVYTYSKVAVYAELGGSLRLARNSRSFATDPVTAAPINLTQDGFTAPYLDTGTGIVDFTATTPGPIRLTTGAVFVDVYSEELPGLGLAAVAAAQASADSAAASADSAAATAAAASVPANTAIDTHLGGDATDLVATVAGKLDTTVASSTYARAGIDSTQRLMAGLKNETKDLSILVVGDSTGTTTDRWVYRFTALIGADWPTWTVLYKFWNDATPGYDAPTTIQTGTGPRTLTIYNASLSGAPTYWWQAARADTAIYALTPDLVMISLGHNEQVVAAEIWHAHYVALSESISASLPGADIMLIGQNPATANTYQQTRIEIYREIAARRGYGFIDVQQAFLDTGDAPGLTVDGVHPTTAGSILWAATVKDAFAYQAGIPPRPQQPSTLTQAGANLLQNPGLALTAGVPTHWAKGSATAAVDTVDFESSAIDGAVETGVVSTAVKFTATAAWGYLGQYVPVGRVRGQWVTFAVRVHTPAGTSSTVARIAISDSVGQSLLPVGPSATGGWRWLVVTRFVSLAATNCRALVQIDTSAGLGVVTIDRASLALGKYPRAA